MGIAGRLTRHDLERGEGTPWARLDGALHNRDELRRELGLDVGSSDERIALCAYQTWGEDFARRLLGEFVVVIWEPRRKQLVCARDRVGIRVLYYRHDRDGFAFASTLTALTGTAAEPSAIDEEMAARLLAWDWSDHERTLHRDVRRVPPAGLVTVTAAGPKTTRYWRVTPGSPIRYRSDSDYAAHFLDLLGQAATCRLSSARPTGIFLSGGVDSATLTLLAHRLRPGAFETFSLYFDDPVCDNTPAIRRVLAEGDWPRHAAYPERETRELDIELAPEYANVWYAPNQFIFRPMLRQAAERGITTVFTGLGGDDVFTPHRIYVADLLRQGRLGAFVRELGLNREAGEGWCKAAWHLGMRSLLPPWLAAAWRGIKPLPAPEWLSAAAALRYDVMAHCARSHRRRTELRGAVWQQRMYHWLFLSGEYPAMFEQLHELGARYGVAFSYPLFDWRLIDFVFRLPLDQLIRDSYGKWILRSALKGVVPEEISFQANTQDYTPMMLRAFDRQKELFESWLRAPAFEHLDSAGALSLWRQRSNARTHEKLCAVLMVERFCRHWKRKTHYEEQIQNTFVRTQARQEAVHRAESH